MSGSPFGTRGSSRGSAALNLAVCVAAFALVAGAIRRLLPLPEASGLRTRFEYFAEHRDEYDVVFIGSSHVMCSVIPELFDEELIARGHSLRSFNFGVPGMLSFETDEYLRRILELRPARMKWVVCELSEWRLGSRYLLSTDRTVEWRTFERTLATLEVEWLRPIKLGKKLENTWGHRKLLGQHVANGGELQKRVMVRLGEREQDPGLDYDDVDRERGYQALEVSGDGGADRARERFLAGLSAWQAKVAAIPARRAAVTELDASQRPPLRRRLALFEAHGLDPLHVVMASDEVEDQPYLMAREADLELWAFCDPERYPELYAIDNRYDEAHLNRDGARLLTRLLAQRFADMLDESGASGD